ncbi:MAG: beta strand repeat-containing protein [Planctomycetota bacterium]|jgi:hypothetical protein
MKKLGLSLLLFLVAASVWSSRGWQFFNLTVADLPATCGPGRIYGVKDGASASDCTVGLGSTAVACQCNGAGTGYAAIAAGGADGVGYDEVLEESVGLTKRAQINFLGSVITCVDNAGGTRTDCTISNHFSPNADPGVDHGSYVAGHSDGANCAAGSYPLGVDAAGAIQNCSDATTEIDSAISTHTGVSTAHHTPTVDEFCTDDACTVGQDDTVILADGAAPTTDGQIEFDSTLERIQVGDDGVATLDFYSGDHTAAFTPNADPGVDHSSYVAGHSDGANCTTSGEWAAGVDAAGAVQSCASVLPANASPTTDGQITWDSTAESIKVGDDGVATLEFVSGSHTADQVGTVTDGSFCQGGAASVLDCDVAAHVGTDITADLEEDAHASEHDGTGTSISGEAVDFAPTEVNDATWGDGTDATIRRVYDQSGVTLGDPYVEAGDGLLTFGLGATGQEFLVLTAGDSTPQNYVQITASDTATTIESAGSDASISLKLSAKGASGNIDFLINASEVAQFTATALDSWTAGPTLSYTTPTATNPTLRPDTGDADTGVGWAGANQLSLVAGGDEFIRGNVGASGVTYVDITPGATGVAPTIAAAGETNLDLRLIPAGTGTIDIDLDCSAGDQYLTTNAGGQVACGTDNDSGGSPAWEALVNTADTATSFVGSADAETVTFDFQSNFSTDRFIIKQTTGNPTGGILLDLSATDPSIQLFQATTSTGAGVELSLGGTLQVVGTGNINASGIDQDGDGTEELSATGAAINIDPNDDGTADFTANAGSFKGFVDGAGRINDEASSSFNPTLIPDENAAGTGIGGSGASNYVSVIANTEEVARFNTAASAVSYLNITPGATGVAPTIQAAGETNLDLRLIPAGTGTIDIDLDCSAGDQYLTTNAGGQIACGTDDSASVGADAIGTAELDDSAETPLAGEWVQVSGDTTDFVYRTDAELLTDTGAASLASPVFTGDPTAPTPSVDDNDTSIATTAFVQAESLGGDVSGTLGTTQVDDVQSATANTEAADNSTTQVATTAFVQQEHDDSAGSCTNQVVTAVNANAAPTCADVVTAMVTDDTLTTADLNDSTDTPLEGQLLAVGQTTTEMRYVKPPPVTKTLFDSGGLAATDDVPDIHIWAEAVEVTDVRCISTGGTSITITLEDDAGNDLVTSCVCTTSLVDCTLAAGVTFSALERLDWTTESISATPTSATAFIEYKYDL